MVNTKPRGPIAQTLRDEFVAEAIDTHHLTYEQTATALHENGFTDHVVSRQRIEQIYKAIRRKQAHPELVRPNLSNEQIVDVMRDAAIKNGRRPLTTSQWSELGYYPSHAVICSRFNGSWSEAWKKVGYPDQVKIGRPPISTILIEEALIRYFEQTQQWPRVTDWDASHQSPSSGTIRRVFGGWEHAVESAQRRLADVY